MVDYTSKWNGFQFRSPNYLDGYFKDDEFDLVKWTDDNHCYQIGRLLWNRIECAFEFESVGLRYLEDYKDGLNEWILAFARMKEIELKGNYDD